nr:DUF58 domain-containing protein [Brevibacillus sp. SYP-B805]
MIRDGVLPTPRLIRWALYGSGVIAAGCFAGLGAFFLWTVNGLLLLLSLIDWITLPKRRQLEVIRHLPEEADIRQPFEVRIELRNRSGHPIRFAVTDDLPLSFEPIEPITGRSEGAGTFVTYVTAGRERGKYRFSTLYLRYSGWLGLWQKQATIPAEQEIKILPDLSAVRGYLSSLQDSLVLDGQRIHKRRASGSEFHAIREYMPDDDPRRINWQATARTGKLMTNLYCPERGKIVTLLLDCGRMMGVEQDNRTRLDLSLEAGLLLAAVALRQGDQVAVLAYSSGIKVYVPPGRGLAHLQTIIEAVYDLQSDFAESNHGVALTFLHRSLKKRSLVVLFSDMESYLLEDQLQAYLMRLRRSHVLLLLSLEDPLLFAWNRVSVTDSKRAYIKSIARKTLQERTAYRQKMIGQGIQVLDVPADRLALTAVNAYLEMKARDVL